MRVFLTHNPEDLQAYYGRALPQLEALADVVKNPYNRDVTTAELIEAAAGCHVIVAHRASAGEAPLFDALPELVAFLRCAVDISTVDVAAASNSGVLVGHAEKSFVPSTAELALALLLDTARNVAASSIDYHNGTEPAQRPGRQLRNQTAGIIGYGAIGSYLAQLLMDVGMRVLVNDVRDVKVADGMELVSFDELIGQSDAVFPLAPAMASTTHMIDAGVLANMQRGATLINVSRGELLDEHAVADAIDSGQLGALGMDVGWGPDQRPSPELAARPNVVATPHLGGLTPENADAQAASSVEQVAAMMAGQLPPRVVNGEHALRLRSLWETSAS